MHFHAIPTYSHRINGEVKTLADIDAPCQKVEEKSLADRMLNNFLALKASKIGRLPASGTGSDLDCLTGKIPRASGVYLLKEEEYYKIGHTTNFAIRIGSIRTSNPREVEVITFIETVNRAQAKRLETALHKFFALKRVRGEWFELCSDDIQFFKDFQLATGQKPLESLDVGAFSRAKKEIAIKSIIQASKSLKRRTMTVQDIMQESPKVGLTFAGWQDILHQFDREKILYFSGNLVRVPLDLIG
ncbi:MAG: GIY-YIG nuclease family protein [Dehalococcoidia bacterium]|jgi:hypothetical protein